MAAKAAEARITPDALSVFRKSSVIRLAMASVSMAARAPLRYPETPGTYGPGGTHATDEAPVCAAERRGADARAGRGAGAHAARPRAEHLPHPGACAQGVEPVQRLGRLCAVQAQRPPAPRAGDRHPAHR